MDYSEIKQFVNVPALLEKYGAKLDKSNRCACPIHGGDNPTAFSVSSDGQTWNCHTKCACGGDIFTLVEKVDGISNAQAKQKIMEVFGLSDAPKPKHKPKQEAKVTGKKSYIYRGKDGGELYRVNRVDFDNGKKQCYQECNGKRTLPPEVRTLYNYDRIYGNASDYIILCEGEKTADAITSCGYIGTTNPLGSKNWNEKYAELLRDQKVVIMPDADEHGEAWRDSVIITMRGIAEQVQVIDMPSEFVTNNSQFSGHDFADYLEIEGETKATALIMDGIEDSQVMPGGIDPKILGRPVDGFKEIVRRAKAGIRTDVFNMNAWMPSLDVVVNKGDVVVLMANTSTGKTRLLHNMPMFIRTVNYALFDLELSFETLCERYGAMANRMSVRAFKDKLMMGYTMEEPQVDNVYIQKVEGLTVGKIRQRVEDIEKITGKEIHVVGVDYIGLMAGVGSSYEDTTNNVEAFKAYISESGKVGVLTTQVSRPTDKESGMYRCPTPFSAKNSGSVENSAQLLMGFWKDEHDQKKLWTRCLKYTHGQYPSHDIPLDANDLIITEAEYYEQL